MDVMLEIKENEPLANHTTFKLGGPARYLAAAKSKEDIIEAVDFAKGKNLPFYILSGGSNILVGDKGYNGVIIKPQIGGVKIEGEKLTAGAGALLSQAMNMSIQAGLSGLEWAAGVPGTMGGAINGNAGAYGQSISDFVESVDVLEEDENGNWIEKRYGRDDCRFLYRQSIFKKNDNRKFVIGMELKLKPGNKEESMAKIKDILTQRRQKVPPQPSAGCVFKNIKSPDGKELICAVGPMIQDCGLKGVKVGGAEVSPVHANYVVNASNATSQDVIDLIKIVQEKVKEKFNIDLETEIVML